MQIREMVMADYEAVYQLWLSCKGMGLNNVDDSREGIAKFLDRNPETCFVAVEQEKILGVIMAGHDGRRGYIYHTAVDPTYRYQGVGRQLVNHALKALDEQDIKKVALVVFEKNLEGNDFWQKCGFTIREDLVYRNRALTDMIRIDT